MPSVFHPVTPAFLTALAPLTSDGARALLDANGNVRHPMIAADRLTEWTIGTTAGIAITSSTVAELHGSTANGDGTYTITATGARRALYLTSAGACEPGLPPPPRP